MLSSSTLRSRLRDWIRLVGWAFAVEAAAFLVGAILRLRLHHAYYPTWGYDGWDHQLYITTLAREHRIPRLEDCYVAYHPFLYYWLAALLVRWRDAGIHTVQWLSIGFGIARLGVLWHGLRKWLPDDPIARVAALALAAVLPCGVQQDGMTDNEPLNSLVGTATIVLVPQLFRLSGRARLRRCALAAVLLTAGLFTKMSAAILLVALAAGAGFELFAHRASGRRALRRAIPVLVALSIAAIVGARANLRDGHLFATPFELVERHEALFASVRDTPYLDRRTLGFFISPGLGEIVRSPGYPANAVPSARLAPLLVATTFGDYYNYNFAGQPTPPEATVVINGRPMATRFVRRMALSTLGGVLIAVATAIALVVALAGAYRRRDAAEVTILFAPVLAILGQVHFAVKYPFDVDGVIKGHYLQYAAAPLFAAFGLAVSYLWRTRRRRALAYVELAAVAAVAQYTIGALFR